MGSPIQFISTWGGQFLHFFGNTRKMEKEWQKVNSHFYLVNYFLMQTIYLQILILLIL